MRFKILFAAFALFAGVFSSRVIAQQVETDQAGARAQPEEKGIFQKETEPKSNFSFQLFYQLYYFQDKDFYDKFFDHDYIAPVGISIGGYPIQNLGVNLNVAYAQRKGHSFGLLDGDTDEESGEEVRLTLIPVELELVYRFDFLNEQALVPVVGGGGDWFYYKQKNEFSDDAEGNKSGYHATAGLGILLDRLDPSSKLALKEYGIENVFLELEARWAWMQTNDGFDFSGTGYSAGLLFEF